MQIDKSFAKCMMCIKDGSAAEKDVVAFHPYGVCLCEKHLWQIVKNKLFYYGYGGIEDEGSN